MFPDLILPTGRLVLRPFAGSDVDDVVEAASDELTQRWLPLPNPYTREAGVRWCTEAAHDERTRGEGVHCAIVPAAGGRLAGCIGLKKTDWAARVTEIGYWMAPWARGDGYAAEATAALARWALREHGFQRVELFAATGNLASQRVAEKAGFVREGLLRNAGYVHAGRVDLFVYSLVPADLGEAGDPLAFADAEALR